VERADALAIAESVTQWYESRYAAEHIDRKCYGNQIYRASIEDSFRVWVVPQLIRMPGERDVSGA
jgi:hypothetical protein